MSTTAKAEKIFSRPDGGDNIRVKGASERYSEKRASAVHVKTRLPVHDEWGEEVSRPSQKSLAISGVVLKHAARKAGISVEWSEHDQALLMDAIDSHEWASYQGEPDRCKIYAPGSIKAALLDDSTSGGLEAAPIVFDQDWISTPLLTGELLPMVDVRPISRGRRIEGGQISTPSVQWDEGDSTEGTLFDSTGLISALDSTVFDLSCHIEIGRNFMSETPLQIGNMLVSLIGERMSSELEKVIAVGSGSQPQGVMTASGTTAVAFSSAAPTIAKYLELLFSVPKQLRTGNVAFVSNELSYRRLRALQTGISGDVRLALGSEVEDWSAFQRPYKICSHMANTQIFFGSLSAYRLYRRLGSQIEWTIAGEHLQRRNLALLSIRQRWAGRVMRGSSFAVVSDAQT